MEFEMNKDWKFTGRLGLLDVDQLGEDKDKVKSPRLSGPTFFDMGDRYIFCQEIQSLKSDKKFWLPISQIKPGEQIVMSAKEEDKKC